MQILVLNFNLKGVGTYQRSFYFSRELARRGHDVTMFTVSRDSKFHPKVYFKKDWVGQSDRPVGEGPWVRIIEGPNWGYRWLPGWGSGPLDIWLRTKEILTGDYDVVYGFEYHPNVSWPVYSTRLLKPYRFFSDWCDWFAGVNNTFRGWKLAHKVDGFFEERIRLIAHKVTTNSSLLRQRTLHIGIPEDRVMFVPQGCDPHYIKVIDSEVARKRLGLPLDIPLVGMRIDLYWREGLDVFREVRQRVPSAHLLVIGRKQPGLSEYAEQIGLGDAVIETGWVSDEDYPLYLASADVLFLVLKNDLYDLGRWPGKIGDYLAAGRPTVVVDVGDAAAFIKKHNAGLVVHDLEEMAFQIAYLLSDGESRHFYGEQARKAAVNHLDWQVLGDLINRVVVE
jgi:glycosyltransferase involved in cell wall biosynthesis